MADGMTHDAIVTAPATLEMSADFAEFAKAMPAAQKALGAVVKKTENTFTGSKYANLAAVIDAVIEPLNENGFSVIQAPATTDAGRVSIVTMLLHSSGQWMRSVLELRPTKNDPQGIGSAITYGRRYALMSLAGVAPEDDDGNAASQPQQQRQAPQKKQAPPQVDPAKAQADFANLTRGLRETHSREEQTEWFRSNKQRIDGLPSKESEALNAEMRMRAESYKAKA